MPVIPALGRQRQLELHSETLSNKKENERKKRIKK
jgi:hypothetical protein